MKKKYHILILTLLIGFCGQTWGAGFDKVGVTSYTFLKINTNALLVGMGSTISATGTSVAGVFHNPSSIGTVENLSASASYSQWLVETNISSFALAYAFPNLGVIALHGMHVNMGEINVTRVDQLGFNADGSYNPGLTGETINPSALSVGGTFTRGLTDRVTIGLTGNYVTEDLVESKASNMAFNAGIQYRTGFKSLVLGTSITNIGPQVTFEEESFAMPNTFNFGFSMYLMGEGNQGIISSPGAHSLLFAYDLQHPRDHSQQHKMGLEYSLFDVLYLRGGYKINFDAEDFTAGFGIRTAGLNLDYAFNSFSSYFDGIHMFTLGFSI